MQRTIAAAAAAARCRCLLRRQQAVQKYAGGNTDIQAVDQPASKAARRATVNLQGGGGREGARGGRVGALGAVVPLKSGCPLISSPGHRFR